MEEIWDIPGTLNGLYLWLCLKQFNKKNFAIVRPLVNILLASNNLTESELYEVVSIAGAVSSQVKLETRKYYLKDFYMRKDRSIDIYLYQVT